MWYCIPSHAGVTSVVIEEKYEWEDVTFETNCMLLKSLDFHFHRFQCMWSVSVCRQTFEIWYVFI